MVEEVGCKVAPGERMKILKNIFPMTAPPPPIPLRMISVLWGFMMRGLCWGIRGPSLPWGLVFGPPTKEGVDTPLHIHRRSQHVF